MSSHGNIIVVGAGIIGASIAWYLVRQGVAVTIVAALPEGEATPASFAWINASWGNPEFYFRLRARSMAEWNRLAAALPELPLDICGSLRWDLPDEEREAYAEQHGHWGYSIRRVDREQSAAIEPNLRRLPDLALHAAEEGAVEPAAAAKILLADAIRHGATLLSDVEVSRLLREGGKIIGIETAARNVLNADHVVLAAGSGTPALAASVGVEVPLETPPGLIIHSHPHPGLLSGLVLAPDLHMRQTAEGRIVAGADFGGSDPGMDPQAEAAALLARVKAMLRGADDLALDFVTIGRRPTPSDGFPILGAPDGIAGLYLAVMHSGVTLAPLVGLLAADEILGRRHDPLLAPFRLSRFAAG